MISTNVKELTTLTQEAATLAAKQMSNAERRRFTFLTGTAIPAVKAGATLAEVNQIHLNDFEKRQGLPITRNLGDSTPAETRAKALFMRKLYKAGGTKELRTVLTENEGNLLTGIGTYSGLGEFVPTAFNDQVFHTMKSVDPLFDENCVTLKRTATGSPIQIPLYDDVDAVATQISEAGDTTGDQVLLENAGIAKLGAYSWRSPLQQFSTELFQDAGNDDEVASAMSVFAEFAASRCARGIGQSLVVGNGSGSTLGLLSSLQAAGVTGVVAAGSAPNDGSANTGANSIGSQDLARLYFSVAEPYRYSSKCGWLMNDSTALFLSKQLDKMGRPLLALDGPGPTTLMGKRVLISPSMPSIGSEAITITFGDMSYWNTRLTGGRIQVFKETYVERGIVALQYYLRADGCLAFAGDPANSPINYLIQHS